MWKTQQEDNNISARYFNFFHNRKTLTCCTYLQWSLTVTVGDVRHNELIRTSFNLFQLLARTRLAPLDYRSYDFITVSIHATLMSNKHADNHIGLRPHIPSILYSTQTFRSFIAIKHTRHCEHARYLSIVGYKVFYRCN